MGITAKSISRLNQFNCLRPLVMCELGAQNTYFDYWWNKIGKDYFVQWGIEHRSYDIIPHQGAEFIDLRLPIAPELKGIFDVVTDFGTTEHIDGDFYQANKNIHDLVKVNGLVIRETPLTEHWPEHPSTYNYLDEKFYEDLALFNGYEIRELTIEYAMDNVIDGGLVCVVYQKTTDNPFMSKENWKKIKFYNH